MQNLPGENQIDNLDHSPFKVNSHREITALLQALCEQKQAISMLIEGSGEARITSILHVGDGTGDVILDVPDDLQFTARLLQSTNISFETVLDRIRILFFATNIEECEFNVLPALRMLLPASLIRLQRREFYRVATPISTPLRCTIQILDGDTVIPASLPLLNVSGGGITIVDDNRLLDNTIGRVYKACQIYLPGSTVVITALEIRNSVDVTLANGKPSRRLGCHFVELPNSMLAVIQRYITRLEREQNARSHGLR